MKTCPHCGSQYTDDTLQFCLQDGTPLAVMSAADTPTAVLSETETFVRPERRRWTIDDTQEAGAADSQVTRIAPAKKGIGVWTIVGIATVVAVVFAAALGVGAYLFFSRDAQTTVRVSNNSNTSNLSTPVNTPVRPSPSASATVSRPTPISSPTPQSAPLIDSGQERLDVIQRVDAWKSALEARDFNGYMNNYADTVDYYKRRGVSVAAIRADKARAFQLFNTMRVSISNESASVSPDGNTATVTFDKEWHFSGRSNSDGKTRSQLEFSRINGRWLITAERDLQLYYKQ